ncbi:MAG: hypothetical protein MSG64_16300 [Pyrinomonadaceae bacterium MAG19_C2-C3]|nr:hypothetical protein [Pyrinomonadaceae bacterium MAG19_C2-C3]
MNQAINFRKRELIILALLFCTLFWLCTSAAQAQQAPIAPAPPPPPPPPYVAEYNLPLWKPFHSPQGRFAALFPDKPDERITPVEATTGRPASYAYSKQTAAAYYIVTYADVAGAASVSEGKDEATTNLALDSARDQIKLVYRGTIKEQKQIRLDGYPGREVRMDAYYGAVVCRVFLVGSRVYQVIVYVRQQPTDSSPRMLATYARAADAFLDSFRLVKVGTPPPTYDRRATSPPAKTAIDAGTFQDGKYTNNQLGFRLEVPLDWIISTRAVRQYIGEIGSRPSNATATAQALPADVLLVASQYPPGNPNLAALVCLAVAEPTAGGTLSRSDVVRGIKDAAKQKDASAEFVGETTSEHLGGETFDVFEVLPNKANPAVRQRYYVAARRNTAISFVLMYNSLEGREKLQSILRTIRFDAA